MRLTVLGRSGRYPEKNGGTSSYLLRTSKVNVIVDMGSGAIAGFQNYIGIEDIDAIMLSHLHGDHMADFLPFNYMLGFLGDRIKKPIEAYRPATPVEETMHLKSRSTIVFHEIEDGMRTTVGDLEFTFMHTNHPVECYAMRIHEVGGRTLLYTADTTMFDGIETMFEGADVVLGDACVLERDWTKKSPHLSVASLARLSEGKHLILTHLPDNEADIADMLSEALKYNSDTEVAKVKATYTI